MAYPAQVDFDADRRITRGHALVQWLVAIPAPDRRRRPEVPVGTGHRAGAVLRALTWS
jgi:hypothetical protein